MHVPWAWPWAVGVTIGVAIGGRVGEGSAGWLVLGGAAVVVAVVAVRGRAPSGPSLAARLAPWLVLGIALGLGRALVAGMGVDPWSGRAGETVELVVRVADGVAWPTAGPRVGLLLRGVDVEDGRGAIVGRLETLPGRRNPGGFDARAHHARQGVTAALSVTAFEPSAGPGPAVRARVALRAGVVAGLDAPAAALMQALTLGVRDDLGPIRAAFAASGLAHVLALSGLHVGVLAGALVVVVRGVGRRRSLVVVAVLVAYLGVVGATPSVVRATAMVSAALLGRAFGVGGHGWATHLALAGAGSLLARPAWLGDLGFGLSYLSVLGMGVAARPLARWWGPVRSASAGRRSRPWLRVHRWVASALAVSVAAQAATLPLIASTFGAVPLLAPVANLVAVPLATLLVPLGFVAGLAGLAGVGAAALVNRLTAVVAAALLELARLTARAPALPWGEVSAVGFVAFALGASAVVAGLHGAWRPWRAAVVAFAAALVTVLVPPAAAPPDLYVLDVGQGDATVVRVSRGQAVLVDGGGTPFGDYDVGAGVVVPALRALGVGALPLVVATHPDLDHVEGLVAVLGAFPVGALVIGHAAPERPIHEDLLAAAAARGVPVIEARRGERYRVGGASFDVLHPTHERHGEANEDSVALLLRWGDDPWALLLGDVPQTIERALAVPPTPVLLVPHHGSTTSTSMELLRAARPRWALVSVGVNRFGHPAPAVLARLDAAGAEVRLTRTEGALRVPYPVPGPPSAAREDRASLD